MVPDPTNPRYSYGGGKIISELMAINYGRKFFDRVLIFRPHNVYGPDMGWEHVIPQFALRVKAVAAEHPAGKLPFEMQGDGRQTRSFCHVDDLVAGVHGDAGQGRASRHLSCRHDRRDHHRRSRRARRGPCRPRDRIDRTPAPAGGTERRCPDIAKLGKLGYTPQVSLAQGLPPTVDWYWANENLAPRSLNHCIRPAPRRLHVFPTKVARAAGSGGSVPVECCQICGHEPLETVLSLGYMPPVNQMVADRRRSSDSSPGFRPTCCTARTANWCSSALAVDPVIIFPPEYPYTSGMTRILRDNFAELYAESSKMLGLGKDDLVVDIGSNDGTLISNFQKGGHRILGIEPTDVSKIANERGIPTLQRYFSKEVAREVKEKHGAAKVVTAANCFAHIEDVHAIVEGIVEMLAPDGVFISESHYLIGLLDDLQYDTVYHEHLRLLFRRQPRASARHARARGVSRPQDPDPWRIDPGLCGAQGHARRCRPACKQMLDGEPRGDAMRERLATFRHDVMLSKLRLHALIRDVKEKGGRICGISAPSRASTLINYVGLDSAIIDYVCEIEGSLKIGKCMPGTLIPVVEESRMFEDQPDCAIIFSWHIADELAPKLRAKGYKGMLVTPLPVPRVL